MGALAISFAKMVTKSTFERVAAERVASINPSCIVRPRQCFFLPETADQFDFATFDYVIDFSYAAPRAMGAAPVAAAGTTPVAR